METIQNNAQGNEQQRVMIAERADLIARKKKDVAALLPYLNELAELFEDLTGRTFTADDLNDAVRNGGRNIRARYIEAEKAAAEAIGVHTLREETAKRAEEFRNPFAERLERLKRCITSEDVALLPYLTVNDAGEVLMTDEDEKRLEEDTHVYLTDPKEVEKYLMHQALTRLLNEFFDDGDGLPVYWWQMFPLEGKRFVMPENGANYAGMLEQVARRRGEAVEDAEPDDIEQQPDDGEAPKAEREPRSPQNRQRGRMAVGISKKPDYTDRGQEARKGVDKISPESEF